MFTVLAFLKGNWKIVAIGLVILGAFLYVQNLRSSNEKLSTQVTQLKQDKKTLEENQQKLETTISAQNQSISKLSEAASSTQKNFDKLAALVNSSSADLSKRLSQVKQETKPKTCDDTIQYLINATKEYSK